MPVIMIQGCGSDVGKTVLVAGLCRLLANRGHSVRPFKAQNMSNNAAVTPDGGEVGRSTALQALACRTPPSVDMNPILLKPQSDLSAQLIVRGERVGEMPASAHGHSKQALLEVALASYRSLRTQADWVIVEGAGSPAETNLRAHDIANMGFAQAADLPVVLIGDIDRGHVIAALVGAHAVLDAADRSRVRAFLINKFRGELTLFADGLTTIEARTGWPSLGVVPWLASARLLPEEDAVRVAISTSSRTARLLIVVVLVQHIANFDDFDPLQHEPDVELRFVSPLQPLPLDADLVILPGSKSTIADLACLREHGWEHELRAYLRRGGRILGICAGYQMLGRVVRDPAHIEGEHTAVPGFALLDIETEMTQHKLLRTVSGVDLISGVRIDGYEMHVGRSTGPGTARPLIHFDDGGYDGAVSADGRVRGCHVHGLFQATALRRTLLQELGGNSVGVTHTARVEDSLDAIARTLATTLDIGLLERIAGD